MFGGWCDGWIGVQDLFNSIRGRKMAEESDQALLLLHGKFRSVSRSRKLLD